MGVARTETGRVYGLVYAPYVREHVHLPLVGSLTAAGQTHFSLSLQGTVPCSPPTIPQQKYPGSSKGHFLRPRSAGQPPARPPALPRCSGARAQVWSHPQLSCTLHTCLPHLGQQPGTGVGMEAKPQLDGRLWPMSSCDEGSVPSQTLVSSCPSPQGCALPLLGLSFPIC